MLQTLKEMVGLTKNPSWTLLSNSVLQDYQAVLKRWIKTSKSKISHTEASIRNIFLKIFYITVAESALSINYSSFLKSEFLRKYNLKRNQFPEKITKFPDLFDLHYKYSNSQLINFYLMVIHRIFKWISENLGVSTKGELKTPYTLPYIKVYELKMVVNMCHENFSVVKESFLRYGGIPALFFEYLSEIIKNEVKTKGKKYSSRKISGSVFTPLWIIQMIRDRVFSILNDNDHQHILELSDISVGYGGFLESFLEDNTPTSQSMKFYGFDVDSNKIDILKLNHSLLGVLNFSALDTNNLQIQDPIIHTPQQKFDILIGNPPWGARLNKSELHQIQDLSQFTVKQYDSYGLFLIRNMSLLKEKGLLYLVLPETFLLNPNYQEIRKYIIQTTTILDIIYLGEDIFENVNMPAIILGIKKNPVEPEHLVNIYLKVDETTILDQINKENTSQFIRRKQEEFLENEGNILDIFTNTEDRKILEIIDTKNNYRLRDLVNNSRGVEIGKKGDVIQCYNCEVWLPTPSWSLDPQTGTKFSNCSVCKNKIFLTQLKQRDRIILDEIPDHLSSDMYAKFLIGENIQKYVISGNKYLILHRRGIKYKSAKLYGQEKLLIRKTARELVACIDYENSYTIQVIYQFSLKKSFSSNRYLLEFLLGLISSQTIQFYYAKKYQYMNRKSFPHHLQKNILNLPVPRIEFGTKNTHYSLFYSKIAFSAMMLMHLSHLNVYHEIHISLHKKIIAFISQNPSILDSIEISEDIMKLFDPNSHTSIKSLYIPEKLQKLIENFQKILDTTVEGLFLSLD
jgi:adenine-specific DNA-methyltransferase